MQHVALVLNVLDDRDQDAGGSLPQEDAVDIRHRIARHEIFDLAVVVAEHYHGNVQPCAADFARELSGIHVPDGKIGDDQIELRIRFRQPNRLRTTGNMGDAGNLAQIEFERFVDEQLVEASILPQDE